MRVQVFAALKDHFDPVFEVAEEVASVEELKKVLMEARPASRSLLDSCRFVVNDTFIEDDFKFKENDSIFIIPPSSGG
jgi:sulfur-carrier protein